MTKDYYDYWTSHRKEWERNYKPEGDRHKVFVYGTLRQGFGNNHHFDDAESVFIGYRRVNGYELYSTHGGGVPMVLEVDDDSKSAYGEVYEVNTDTLEDLDMLEGHPTGWCRRQLKEDPSIWIYTAPTPSRVSNMVYVEDGDWGAYAKVARAEWSKSRNFNY